MPARDGLDDQSPSRDVTLTEMILLGNIALRSGRKLEWDAKKLKVTNDKEANRWVGKEYRSGWGLS
mgnify:CR=1 FL=1